VHRIGIIGCGGIADAHMRGYREAGAEVVAVADVHPATLARRQQEWAVSKGHLDYRDLLADPEIDAVSVCTPNAYHHEATLHAAKAGKHVLCEKPISMHLGQAREMIEHCDDAGVVLQIGHHLRSLAASVQAKKMIDRGDIGRITFARFRQTHDWGGAATVRPSFATIASSGGGTLLDNGCHMFDLARFMGGNVVDVSARIATLKFDVEVEDTAVATLGYESGAIGQVESAWTATGWQESFWVFGTEGSLEYDNREGGVLRHRLRASAATTWADTDVVDYRLAGHVAHTAHVVAFLAAVEGRAPVACTGQDGLEAIRLVLASYESASSGARVVLS
jgi:predicted dehydrogenase